MLVNVMQKPFLVIFIIIFFLFKDIQKKMTIGYDRVRFIISFSVHHDSLCGVHNATNVLFF